MHLITIKKFSTEILLLCIFIMLASVDTTTAQYGLANVQDDTLLKSVAIHPPVETGDREFIVSREHMYKSHLRLGDQLGRDFVVTKVSDNGSMEMHTNEGKSNDDYFGWQNNVLAPFYGTVTTVNHPKKTNKPGVMDRESKPGKITIKNENDVVAIYVHVREISVAKGDTVSPGDVIAKVGNNGISRGPHVHIGAWKNDIPLQIQVDLYAEHRN
jgi:biotin carboxyl carrier protein